MKVTQKWKKIAKKLREKGIKPKFYIYKRNTQKFWVYVESIPAEKEDDVKFRLYERLFEDIGVQSERPRWGQHVDREKMLCLSDYIDDVLDYDKLCKRMKKWKERNPDQEVIHFSLREIL